MSKKLFFLLLIFFCSLAFVSSQNETDKEVKVGIYILNLGKFDISSGSFTADFYLSFKCDNLCPNIDFEFINGRAVTIDKIIDKPNEKFYRIQANLVSPIDLRNFPFDKQKMEIIIEDKRSTKETLVFVPNLEESGFDESIFFTGWKIEDWKAYTREHDYDIYNESYSQFIFEIPITRIKINSVFKTILPITFIMIVMLSSFVLDPDKITTRLSMVGSALVASVMFHVSLANQLPPVSYLTFIDKFMILSYFVILLSFLFNVTLLELYERKKEEKVKRLHRITEFTVFIIVPLLYFLLFILFL
ncbi:MAG: hypothetical protein QW273_03475 [Candidatus Pacearchaeota archaeon]